MSRTDIRDGMEALATELMQSGDLTEDWRDPYRRVPRHLFIPDLIWREQGTSLVATSRLEDPQTWWNHVYANRVIVTQVNDGHDPSSGMVAEDASSSASLPSLVFWMLDELDVRDTHRVLEIGTGTGYSAALLAARVGNDRVTTIEVDPDLAQQARQALWRAGWFPAVVTGDGAHGYTPHAPYDRVIATCSVRHVPYAWVDQTRPGGRIVSPWGTSYSPKGLIRLDVDHDGRATGPFVGGLAFMRLRAQRQLHGHINEHVFHEDQADRQTTTFDPHNVFGDEHTEFGIGVLVPGCQHATFYADDGSGEFTLWLIDGHSWASIDFEPEATDYRVEQYGPRRLWDEVETAYRRWAEWGSPERERFGLTVTAASQEVWLDDPANVVASL